MEEKRAFAPVTLIYLASIFFLLPGFLTFFLFSFFAFYSIFIGLILIFLAYAISSNPRYSKALGALIILFSIVGIGSLVGFIGAILGIIGGALAIQHQYEAVPQASLAPQQPITKEVIREKEIIYEIVKVRCPYCNTLYDATYDKCPYCGGKR